jgi:5-methylcytosine-specific restriction endonuclease McrA
MTEEEHLIVVGKALHVHHIDYNKKNCAPWNLVSTCQWCNLRANKNRKYWQDFYAQKLLVKKEDK